MHKALYPPSPLARLRQLTLPFALCSFFITQHAAAQSTSTRTLNIPSGTLPRALELLGEQSGSLIMYNADLIQSAALIQNTNAPAVGGAVSTESALNALLAGSSELTWERVNQTTFVIKRKSVGVTPPSQSTNVAVASGEAAAATTLNAVSVIGSGSTRTTAAISSQYIQAQAPGVTPQSLLADLPGVNIQMSDPYGMYELNDRMRIRGFEETQIGMTIDGVPFYNSLNEGGTIAHYLLTEDMATAELSAGSGDVTQPAMSALGGSIRYLSKDPTQDLGGQFSLTGGKFGFSRLFAKLNTGSWFEGGPTAYFALERNRVYQWENYQVIRGQGMLEADHFETKIKQEWGYNSLTLKMSYDNRSNWDTKNVGLDYKPDPSGELYSNPIADSTLWAGYWRNGTRDYLYSITGEFHPTDSLTIKATPYLNDHEYWLWYGINADAALASYEDAIAGTPGRTDVTEPNGETAQRISKRSGKRKGVTSSVAWEKGPNTLEFGGWFEDNDYHYYHPIQNTDPTTGKILVDQVVSVNGDFDVNTKVVQLYVKDSLSLVNDRLNIQAGAKGLHVSRHFYGYATAQDFNTSTPRDLNRKYKDWFQPQAGLTWKFGDAVEGFVNYAENFSAVTVSSLTSVVYNPNIKPERSQNIDFGLRFQGDTWSGYLSAYSVKYKDRIISLTTADRLTAVQGSTYLNVNSVDTRGIELSGDWSPAPAWKVTGALSYSDSTYDGDYYAFDSNGDQNVLVGVDGNDLPDQPKLQGNLTAYYTHGHVAANFGTQYMGSRYGDTMNTLKVPSYTIFNGGISYSGHVGEKLEGVTFRLNMYNLFNKTYISSISPNQSSATFKLGYPRAIYGSVEYAF